MKNIWLLLIMISLGAISAPAQLYRYLDTEDGLKSRRVIDIEKDKKGYMWFLTQEGVDRYNGKQYTHYQLAEGTNIIQQFPNLSYLQTDSKGDIWITGKNGYVFKYNTNLDKYELKLNFADTLRTTRRLPLTHISMDRNNRIWLCTKNAQYIYDTENETINQLHTTINEEITSIAQEDENRFFIGTNQQVYAAQLKGHRLAVQEEPLMKDFQTIQKIHYHPQTQSLLIGTLMDGFYHYDIQTRALQNIGNLKDVTINQVVPAYQSDTEVLIATDGNGLYKLDMASKRLQPYLPITHQTPNELNGEIIKDIHLDEEGRIWMAVFPVSVTVYSEKYPKYEWIRSQPKPSDSPIDDQITYLMEDSDGDIWASTGNGVSMFNTRTRKWESILSGKHQEKHEKNHVFISLCESTPGTILVGGYMSGMYRINKKDMVPHYFTPQGEGYSHIRPDKYIRSIYRDEEGNVWAGGYYNLKRIVPSTGEIQHFSIDYPITFITTKNPYELWIGTINGIYKFNKKQQKIQQVNLSANPGSINSIYQANETTTYIGTHGNGLWVYDSQSGKLTNYKTYNSALISNNIFCILPSRKKDELIITTENELVCFNTREKRFWNWTKEQGLPTDKFNTSSGIQTRKGDIILGSDDGLVILKDTISLPQDFHSKLVFSNFNIQYQQMKPGMEGSPLSAPIDETSSITLSHNQNIFSLEVSSINYDCPSRILYSWKLEGFYDEWTKPSTSNLIRYTGLNPGEYTLKVRAVLLDDGQTIEERELHITITPPFSQTIWAMLLYLLILLAIIFSVMRYFWLRKDSLISKEKIQFFINTAHEIRTPLTLIKGPLNEIERAEQLTEQGKHNLQTAIQSTNRLAELATKLIDFQKEEMYSSVIHVEQCELNQYLQDFLKQFQTYADQKQLQMTFVGTPQPLNAWIDRNKIDSIIHNLIGNALKYTPEGGKVSVKLENTSTEWTLRISDTGIGIPAADQKKMFKQLFRGENAINQRITGAGIGMMLVYRLVKQHRGKITVNSKENEGTTFRISFPTDHKKYIRQSVAPMPFGIGTLAMENTGKPKLEAKPEASNGPRILIVEDNPELRNFLLQSLQNSYRVTLAENGKEALDLIDQQQPDLIISDIMMPVMRGDELCQTLKSNMATSHIPIILLTALGDRESILRGLEIKADSYVVKPFDMDILKANIASELANKEFIRQRFAQLNYRTEDFPQEIQQAPGLSLDQEFLTKATELVKKNLGKEFNVDDLCMEMGMSRSSLYNKVKALTDRSPSDFVRQIRMTEAAALLKSKRYTVAEVSDMMGYSDPKYFTDIFKKYYGMTPSAYMKKTEL